MRISDWSSDVCSSDLLRDEQGKPGSWRTERRRRGWRRRWPAELHYSGRLNSGRKAGNGKGLHCGAPFFMGGLRFLPDWRTDIDDFMRSEEHTSELQSLMRISYAVFCLKKKTQRTSKQYINNH